MRLAVAVAVRWRGEKADPAGCFGRREAGVPADAAVELGVEKQPGVAARAEPVILDEGGEKRAEEEAGPAPED
jgi:hypothetical protein